MRDVAVTEGDKVEAQMRFGFSVSSLNEGIGKAVYLAPDTYLVLQVREEAAKLSIATTDDPQAPAFLAAQAMLVTSYYKLINGKSVFGVAGDGREPDDPAAARRVQRGEGLGELERHVQRGDQARAQPDPLGGRRGQCEGDQGLGHMPVGPGQGRPSRP